MRLFARVVFAVALLAQAIASASPKPDFTVMIPMRDGVELPTDIYLPDPSARNLPCILLRSPGGRHAPNATPFLFMLQFGYAVAIQDTRCALDSIGKTLPYCTDAWGHHQDGYDAVQWLAKSEYTNGSIGTLGASAIGITQLLMAPTAPPALKCQYIGMASANLHADAIFPGGQILKNQVEGWLGLYARDSEVLEYVKGSHSYSSFWNNFNTVAVADRITVPAIHYGGWYDTFLKGTLDGFLSRQHQGGPGAKGTQKLVIGPWTHLWPLVKTLGDFDIPKEGFLPPLDFAPQHWFDYHLKGLSNGVEKLPSVTYYVMGPLDGTPSKGNVWRHAENWPVPAQKTPFYLTYDFTLSDKAPETINKLSYHYDPYDPTPTVGGRNLFLEAGPKDQRSLEKREDVLVFTSPILESDLEVTGHILAEIYLSSNRSETDLAVRLTDVYPDGRSILIADGLTRTFRQPESMVGEPQRVEVDLWDTSTVFAKGHRIRISISSANYPRFEKNLNGGSAPLTAENSIHFGGENAASVIFLPIVAERL